MIYPIVKYPDPVLSRRGADWQEFGSSELDQLIGDMFATMYAANGVGLAAPQIGRSQRLTVIDCSGGEDPAQKLVLLNPVIVARSGKQTGEEGCLSIPGFRADVTRAQTVRVRAQNAAGEWLETEGADLLARAIQHEVDHLNGVLFINHLSTLRRDLIKRKIRKLQKDGEW
ncbi:MAG: peptide deformylase [Terriglobales bacterium]